MLLIHVFFIIQKSHRYFKIRKLKEEMTCGIPEFVSNPGDGLFAGNISAGRVTMMQKGTTEPKQNTTNSLTYVMILLFKM